MDISNTANICGWVACKSKGTWYPEESARHTLLSARTWHQGYLVEQCVCDWTVTLPDIEEAFPLGRPRPHPAHSGAFATVVAVMDQSKIPIKSQNIISVMFPCFTVFYFMCTVHHVALSVLSNRCSPHSRPNPSVKHSLVIKLPVPHRNIKQPLPYVHSFLQVVVVVGAPQASEDGGDVERTVAHDVELALLLYPLVHCSLFPRHQIAVHIP